MDEDIIVTIFGGGLMFLWLAWFFIRPQLLYREQIKEQKRIPKDGTTPDKPIDGTFIFYIAQSGVYFFIFSFLIKGFSVDGLLMKFITISMLLLGVWMLIHGVLFYRLLNLKK